MSQAAQTAGGAGGAGGGGTIPIKKTRRELAEKVGEMISSDRNETHGDPHVQFHCAQRLKDVLNMKGKLERRSSHVEATDWICTKLSRIRHGNANEIDHWLDIAGYALIAAEACQEKG